MGLYNDHTKETPLDGEPQLTAITPDYTKQRWTSNIDFGERFTSFNIRHYQPDALTADKESANG